MPIACAPTAGPGALEGRHRRVGRAPLAVPSRARASRASSFSLPPSRQRAGDPHLVEHHLGGVRGADAVLGELLALAEPLGAGRHHEAGLAAGPQLRVDDGGHDVDVGDAAVGGPGLGAVETHSSFASSYVARVRIAPTSLPASGSEEQNAPSLRSPGVPYICGHPLADLLVGAVGARRRPRRATVPTMESPMPASPQNSSSMAIGKPSPVSSKRLGGEEVERVEARPWRPPRRTGQGNSSLLVPLGRRRPDHVGGEGVHPRRAGRGGPGRARTRASVTASVRREPRPDRPSRACRAVRLAPGDRLCTHRGSRLSASAPWRSATAAGAVVASGSSSSSTPSSPVSAR